MEETLLKAESGRVADPESESVSDPVPPLRELAVRADAVENRNVEPAVPEPRRVAADDAVASKVTPVE
jgi:hypothetical protein